MLVISVINVIIMRQQKDFIRCINKPYMKVLDVHVISVIIGFMEYYASTNV